MTTLPVLITMEGLAESCRRVPTWLAGVFRGRNIGKYMTWTDDTCKGNSRELMVSCAYSGILHDCHVVPLFSQRVEASSMFNSMALDHRRKGTFGQQE